MRPLAAASIMILAAACATTTSAPAHGVPPAETSASPVEPPSTPAAAAAERADDEARAGVTRPPTTSNDGPPPTSANAAALAFASDFYRVVRDTPGNRIVSPWSAWIALSMTAAGAEGPARDIMNRLLRIDGLSDPHAEIGALAGRVATDAVESGTTWNDANRIYADRRLANELVPEFERTLADAYSAEVGLAGFRADPEAARVEINAWVSDQTRERIPDLLSAGAITPDTRMVLVNAIYFLADWMTQFDADLTSDQPFHLGDDTQVEVSTMHRSGSMRAVEHNGVWAVVLPYAGGRFELVVLVPPVGDVARAESLVIDGALHGDGPLAYAREREVRLWLPKFTMRTNGSLLDALAQLGLTPNLLFTGMFRNDPLEISDVIQEAFIEVDERGTEAAAATAVIMRATSMIMEPPAPPVTIRADRPFVVVLRHTGSGVPLFIGRVTDPR